MTISLFDNLKIYLCHRNRYFGDHLAVAKRETYLLCDTSIYRLSYIITRSFRVCCLINTKNEAPLFTYIIRYFHYIVI